MTSPSNPAGIEVHEQVREIGAREVLDPVLLNYEVNRSVIVVTMVPVLVGYLFGRHILGLNPALLLGSITGAMTSTPAMNVVTRAARSSVPALGYAGTYTFSNVLLMFAGTLMMVL